MRKSQQEEMEHVTVEENSPKRVHIIETKLIDGPARGMSPIQVNRHLALKKLPRIWSKTRNFSFKKIRRNFENS